MDIYRSIKFLAYAIDNCAEHSSTAPKDLLARNLEVWNKQLTLLIEELKNEKKICSTCGKEQQ